MNLCISGINVFRKIGSIVYGQSCFSQNDTTLRNVYFTKKFVKYEWILIYIKYDDNIFHRVQYIHTQTKTI